MRDLRFVVGAGVVAIDPDPVHLAVPAHFVLTDDRHVVLRLTRDHARRTAGAGVEIDGHAPAMPRGRMIVRPRGHLRSRAALRLRLAAPVSCASVISWMIGRGSVACRVRSSE